MDFVLCKCGCGERVYPNCRGRIRTCVNGHQMVGVQRTPEWKSFMSEVMRGSNNHRWNGNRDLVFRRGMAFSKVQRRNLCADRCSVCGNGGVMNLDHIIPIVAGGTNADSNAQTLCVSCNQRKKTEELRYYKKLGELMGHPTFKWDNHEPSQSGNTLEGATTRRRAVRKKRAPAAVLDLVCKRCGAAYIKLARHFRPQAAVNFCGMSCRTAYFNSLRHGSNSPTSAQQESGGADSGRYSLISQVTVRSQGKELGGNKNCNSRGGTTEVR